VLVLGIETSCDETAAAVVEVTGGRYRILSSVVSSQIDLHARYGGVVPEIASRAHLELLPAAVAQALEGAGVDGHRLDAVAATIGPGLIGALLVGVSTAKALTLVWGCPFVGVNHLEAHLFAPLLEAEVAAADLELPLLVLLVSGGHTLLIDMAGPGRYRLLGQTLDDAAGEAFDKVARYLGLGYPGGPVIDRLAREGDARAIAFPRSMLDEGGPHELDFSFSGLKTSVVNHVRRHPGAVDADVCASFQEAVVDVLVAKSRRAAAGTGARGMSLAGGVAANSRLRERWVEACVLDGRAAHLPSRAFCTDNAAMIAAAGAWRLTADGPTPLDVGADPNLALARRAD
jgi:N6-L-threonylcarbamoyladenine synthase